MSCLQAGISHTRGKSHPTQLRKSSEWKKLKAVMVECLVRNRLPRAKLSGATAWHETQTGQNTASLQQESNPVA